jgi:hypothetical protein
VYNDHPWDLYPKIEAVVDSTLRVCVIKVQNLKRPLFKAFFTLDILTHNIAILR